MTKIISAQSILRQKGFVKKKFDTNGFMEEVGKYFLQNPVESKLLLIPYRFLDIQVIGDDPCDVVKQEDLKDMTDADKISFNNMEGITRRNPFNVKWNEHLLGYKAQTEMDGDEPRYIRDLIRYDFENFQAQKEAGILFPRMIVDKPFFENAAGALRIMGGYIVEKRVKRRCKMYWVTLI